MIEIRNITSNDDLKNFLDLEPDKLHIVKFGAPWCGPCRTLTNTIRNLDSTRLGGTLFGNFDIDEDDTFNVGETYDVINIPTTIFFKDGNEVTRTQGNVSANILYETISKFL